MNELLQWVTVAVIIAIAVAYTIRKLFRKNKNGCAGCELNGLCGKQTCDNVVAGRKKSEQKPPQKR